MPSAAKCFSLVDIKDGFPYILLDDESSWMTTMHTSYARNPWLPLAVQAPKVVSNKTNKRNRRSERQNL